MISTSRAFETFEGFSEYLDALGLFHMDLGLGRVRAALASLGLERLPHRTVQVAGTNGKGSTSAMLARLLTEHGASCGLFTSPHFVSVTERIAVNGRPLDKADWLEAANDVLAASGAEGEGRLTYFELLTVMAARLFAEKGVDAAVFETGLGGRHDAVTALSRDLVLFTPIGLDHARILGDNAADIARDKAGAMSPGVPALTGVQDDDVLAVLRNAAGSDVPFYEVGGPGARRTGTSVEDVRPGMAGAFQGENARLALAAARRLAERDGWTVQPEKVRLALAGAFVPGRLQSVAVSDLGLPCVLDCAHNPPALEALRAALREMGVRPAAVVFACLGDKDPAALAPRVRALCPGPILVPEIDAPGRALPASELAGALGPGAEPVANVAGALAKLAGADGPVLLCGSMYLLADFFRLYPEALAGSPNVSSS